MEIQHTIHEVRDWLEKDGVKANIPVNPRNGRRQIPYDEEGYKVMRSAVERFNSWLNIQKSNNKI
jgi:hypothetical protein